MKKFYLFILFSLSSIVGWSQFDPGLRKECFDLYPTLRDMYGFAVGEFQDQTLVIGGRIRSDVPELYPEDFPNTEIILIDHHLKRASAFSSGGLSGPIGEQMAATGFGYYQKGEILYILGGYGYSESQQQFVTFPYLTAVDLRATIAALLKGENPVAFFLQICDERLAIFDGVMDYNGEEFFLLKGRQATKLRPFEDNPSYFEQSFDKEARTFQIMGDLKRLKIENFKTWTDLEAFRDYYGPLLPDRVEKILREQSPRINQ